MNRSKRPTLGSTIQTARKTVGWSIRKLATESGVHHSYIARIESGENDKPTADVLQRLADALSTDASDLLAYIGVQPALPEPKVYFRRAYGMSEHEAAEAAAIIENLRAHQREQQIKEGGHNDNTD